MLQRWDLGLQFKKGKNKYIVIESRMEKYIFPMHWDDTGLTMLNFSKGGKLWWGLILWRYML